MADELDMTPRKNALREDLSKEYYAILGVVSEYDGRLMVVKGWSVTLSLAGLGLGFQQQHYALFALAAATALAFWFIDMLMKGYQLRYYSRMRDIEYAAFQINAVPLGDLGTTSAPRIDMSWPFKGDPLKEDWRADPPLRRTKREIHALLRRPYLMPQVLLPHAVAVVLGAALFLAAVQDTPGLDRLQP
jgi:hypothetical protein